ncbi:hypothetical protein IUY40_02720 [Flavobacterium sp. ALJ2]|uniref:hypothetical protein n=1 Tax=Flavobacterium sp. ALJ2 TaxID=2786960 RepID=UPI00189FF2AF|nr:hypothetical protein [Flavobacterium sp. ALJ2]MBF7090458.1 hypothetical protein [Flavobacterium sp. ALJ2]
MSTTANLATKGPVYDAGNDTIVIVKVLEAIPGGKTLDVTSYTPDVIPAGHLIIKETSTGVLKPMPISGTEYADLPASHIYEGVLISTILKAKPFAGIMVRGTVNKNASFYGIASVLTAVKSALPLIRFTQD